MMTVAFAAEVSLHLLRQEELKDDCCGWSEKKCSHSPHKTRLRGLIGNVQRICLSVYMPRNDSVFRSFSSPRRMMKAERCEGVFFHWDSTIYLLCCYAVLHHVIRPVIVLHFSGYGTSEEGHAKRTGRRGHLMQQKTAGKEFSFGRFWRFWFVWGFVDGFWLVGIVSLRGFKNFVPPDLHAFDSALIGIFFDPDRDSQLPSPTTSAEWK